MSKCQQKPQQQQQQQSQYIFVLGSSSTENDGYIAEHSADISLLGPIVGGSDAPYMRAAPSLDLGPTICVRQIVCSEKQLFCLSECGKVYAIDAKLNGDQVPVQVDGFGGVAIVQLAGHCEGKHMMALAVDRQVYSWGFGESGRLGHGDFWPKTVPARIEHLSEMAIDRIYCGAAYSAAISIMGVLYTWGNGLYGCLGHGTSENKMLPQAVQALTGHAVVDVALGAGDSHSLCVTAAGLVFAWGDNDFGKLGNGSCKGCQVPVQIMGLPSIARVYTGNQFSVALAFDGSVYTWGKCHGGGLGHGHNVTDGDDRAAVKTSAATIKAAEPDYCSEPKKLEALAGKLVVDIAVGSAHCLARTNNGEVYGWGRNDFQQICPLTVCREPIIATPILTTPHSLRITGMACGSQQSILWRHTPHIGLATRLPFVVDLVEPTFRLIDQLLTFVCPTNQQQLQQQQQPSQESECIAVACLNLLRLQLHALISNNVDVTTVGLSEGSRLLVSLKTRILALAGGPTILKSMQDSAQRTLQVGWSVFLPTASERAQTLTALLPSEPGVSTAGHRFMTDLLVSSLMAEEGLQTALKQAINADAEDLSGGHNLPLLHLIKQLLRNNAALTKARLAQLAVPDATEITNKKEGITNNNTTTTTSSSNTAQTLSPSMDLLHRFQRLLLAHIHQTRCDDMVGAEALLAKYIHHMVSLCTVTLTRAQEVASSGRDIDGVVDVLTTDISDTLLYELLIGLVLLHRDGGTATATTASLLSTFDWSAHFMPLLSVLDALNRLIGDADVQDADDMGWPGIVCRGGGGGSGQKTSSMQMQPADDASLLLVRQSDFDNHILDGGRWIILNGIVYDVQDFQCDNAAAMEILTSGIGKDLTVELAGNNVYRCVVDAICAHFKVGKFVFNDSDEKVSGSIVLFLVTLYYNNRKGRKGFF